MALVALIPGTWASTTISLSSPCAYPPGTEGCCPVSIKALHIPLPRRGKHNLPHCLSEVAWWIHSDIESAIGQNHEQLRWHFWSINLTSEHGNFFFLTLSLQQEKKLHLSCFNCSHKLNLMSLPIYSSFPLRWSPLCTKSPVLQLPLFRKVLLVFFGRYLSEEKNAGSKEAYTPH